MLPLDPRPAVDGEPYSPAEADRQSCSDSWIGKPPAVPPETNRASPKWAGICHLLETMRDR